MHEVAWTRLLALVIGPTTYAFATMAAAFISGLAIGSALGTRLARRAERPAVWLAAMLVASALAASGAARRRTRMPPAPRGGRRSRRRVARVVITQAFATALLLLPMTLPRRYVSARPGCRRGGASTIGRDAARLHRHDRRDHGALAAGFALVPRSACA